MGARVVVKGRPLGLRVDGQETELRAEAMTAHYQQSYIAVVGASYANFLRAIQRGAKCSEWLQEQARPNKLPAARAVVKAK